jgi:hypothetical protein
MAHKKKRQSRSLISAHLPGIKRALLEGEKRATFLAFLESNLPSKQGIYALYDKKGRLYYSGKASDLPKRLNHHLKDRHGESWELMTLFLVANTANVAQLEGLVVAAARPPGNKQWTSRSIVRRTGAGTSSNRVRTTQRMLTTCGASPATCRHSRKERPSSRTTLTAASRRDRGLTGDCAISIARPGRRSCPITIGGSEPTFPDGRSSTTWRTGRPRPTTDGPAFKREPTGGAAASNKHLISGHPDR